MNTTKPIHVVPPIEVVSVPVVQDGDLSSYTALAFGLGLLVSGLWLTQWMRARKSLVSPNVVLMLVSATTGWLVHTLYSSAAQKLESLTTFDSSFFFRHSTTNTLSYRLQSTVGPVSRRSDDSVVFCGLVHDRNSSNDRGLLVLDDRGDRYVSNVAI